MKETGNSSEEYMKLIEKSNLQFYQNQEELLENNLNYSKTRYSIIVSGLKKLLENNKPYEKLAFFLCLLDSLGISKEYFYKISDPFTADKFIYDLKKYSIITEQNGIVSIHRLSQDISFRYLISTIPENEIAKFLDEIINNFCVYKDLGWFLYESNKREMRVSDLNDLYIHYIALLKSIEKLPLDTLIKDKIKTKVLLAILHASKYVVSSQKIMEQAIKIIANNEKFHVLDDLDLAVVYEILGRKSIRLENKTALKCFKKCLELCKNTKGARCLESVCLADYAKALCSNGESIEVIKELLNRAIAILSPADCFWKKQTGVTVFTRYQQCLSGYYVSSKQLMDIIFLGNKLLKEFKADNFFYKKKDYKGDDELSIFMIRRNMAAAYNRMGLTIESSENIREAQFFLDNFSKKDSSIARHQGILYLDLGRNLLEQGKASEAIKILNKAIHLKETAMSRGGVAMGCLFRAESYILLRKYKEALKDCEKFSDLQIQKKGNENNSDKISRALNAFNYAVIYHKLNDADSSLENISEFFKIIKNICEKILNKQIHSEFIEQQIFECDKSMGKNFTRAKIILKAIFGENHPMVKEYFEKVL